MLASIPMVCETCCISMVGHHLACTVMPATHQDRLRTDDNSSHFQTDMTLVKRGGDVCPKTTSAPERVPWFWENCEWSQKNQGRVIRRFSSSALQRPRSA